MILPQLPIPQLPYTNRPIRVHPNHTTNSVSSRRTSIDPDSVSSHHTFNNSNSTLGRSPSNILDNTSSRRSFSSSDSTPSHHIPNSPSSVSVRFPSPGGAQYSHPAYITDSGSSRRTSTGSVSIPIPRVWILQSLIPPITDSLAADFPPSVDPRTAD